MGTKVVILFLLISCSCSISLAQDTDVQKSNWLLGVIFKLENMKDKAIEDIKKYEVEIQKCDNTISKSENIIGLARQQGNARAEGIAREALNKAQAAKTKNLELKRSAELNKKRAEVALAYVNSGGKDLEAKLEQVELENSPAAWKENQKQLIEERLREPNLYAGAIYKSLSTKPTSLTTKAPPPLPPRRYDELQPGDVLLINGDLLGSEINAADRLLSGDNTSRSSHTVIYLKEVNGKKLFLENVPGEGPRIISGDEFLERYSSRGARVAELAQPLNAEEAKKLWAAAAEMATKNTKKVASNWLGLPWLGTNYGVWGKDNLVCSEADWSVLRAAGREIPESDDWVKKHLGVSFSPADFFNNEKYFIVSPLPPASRSIEEHK